LVLHRLWHQYHGIVIVSWIVHQDVSMYKGWMVRPELPCHIVKVRAITDAERVPEWSKPSVKLRFYLRRRISSVRSRSLQILARRLQLEK
jgi:hypothetical protein